MAPLIADAGVVPACGARGATRPPFNVTPDGFHLFAGDDTHFVVVEGVFGLLVLGSPDDGFGGVGEIAATQIRRRIWFFPGDVVEDFEAELLHGVADAENHMVRAADPDGPVGFEDALAAFEPRQIKFVVEIGAAAFVPVTFIDLYHSSGVASDPAVREKIRRVGENHVETTLRIFGGNDVKKFEAVSVVNEDVSVGIAEDELRVADCGLGVDRAVVAKGPGGLRDRRRGHAVSGGDRCARRRRSWLIIRRLRVLAGGLTLFRHGQDQLIRSRHRIKQLRGARNTKSGAICQSRLKQTKVDNWFT